MKRFLTNAIQDTIEYKQLRESLTVGHQVTALTGLWETSAALWVETLRRDFNKNILVVAANESEAKAFHEALTAFSEDHMHYPTKELVLFDAYAHSHQILNQRISVMNKLCFGDTAQIVVAPIESLMTKIAPKELWLSERLQLKVGSTYKIEMLLKQLLRMGYEREDIVDRKGCFSKRGGILDIFVSEEETPYRIEFFDEEIDSIRRYDPTTQLSIEKMDMAIVGPATESVLTESLAHQIIHKIEKSIKKITDEETLERLETLVDQLHGGMVPENIDKYYGMAFSENFNQLVDYLGADDLVVWLDSARIRERFDATLLSFEEALKDYLERQQAIPDQVAMVVDHGALLKCIKRHQVITVDAITKRVVDFQTNEIVSVQTMESPLYHGKLEELNEDLKKWLYKGYKVVIALGSENKCKNVAEELREERIPFLEGDFERLNSGICYLINEEMKSGFQLNSNKLIVLTDKELFGVPYRKKSNAVTRKKGQLIKSFNELAVGNLVVHENHGIARYIGLDQLMVDGLKRDYMKLHFSGDDFLYVPVENMDAIQKYVGGEEASVKMSKLGTGEWQRAKAKVKKSIEDMTDELLKLYAQRQSKRGHAFSPDTDWQKNFEDLFPYEETQDQLKSIVEIKADMEQELPMERLLCGDVGYGKTEVAIRAIFKAAMDGKQVAFLVPTTILAQQHFNNLTSRFSKFPIRVEMLSRFRTKKQQDKIIEDLRVGVVDVIVGTHRILSKDVEYKDLGLLVIDEEQRFGVKHKESVKLLKKNVDVLTLTATPIPRTLHMSLIGIRDMSVLEDPPEDRYPIQTYVVESDERLIRDWILREVDRGGQVFYVHNKVQDIDSVAGRLRELMPDVRIEYAHGQMAEGKLEKLMMAFLNHEFDVLVCTTIIETGLDIANVNTIIVNDADKMGLSQLYQLRGRVGRSNRIAYAYLTYQKNKVLSEIAEKRLKAIKEFTELGAGFKIAMKDLEIRGAGNLLGSDQSGHMSSVGYEMYCKMLEEEIRKIKGEEVETYTDTTIEFSINAFIPDQYIHQPQQKLDMYKRISGIRNKDEKYRVEEEIEDRYGTLPQAVYNLTTIAHTKALSQKIGISLVKEHDEHVNFYFIEKPNFGPETVLKATELVGKRVSFNMAGKPYMKLKYSKPKLTKEKRIAEIEAFLEHLVV